MDKVKIKSNVGEIKQVIDELVSEGKLDGDAGAVMLQRFVEREIEKEIIKSEGV